MTEALILLFLVAQLLFQQFEIFFYLCDVLILTGYLGLAQGILGADFVVPLMLPILLGLDAI